MKLRLGHLIAVLFFSINICFGNQSEIAPDSIPGKVTTAVLKINPIQFLFNEIPVSFELFSREESSAQLQVGYIFPTSGSGGLFESNGTNGDASSKGLLSYRNSPFNNHGISVKFEFRKYRKNNYHGAHFMFKHCYYKNAVFPLYSSGFTYDQKENKSSTILGFGYVIGQQSDDYPDTLETFTSFYPFLNLGDRIGFRFQKTVWV